MQSTSYSSTGGSFNIQVGSSNMQQQINQFFNQQRNQQPMQSRVQNNQLNQNTRALKQQMQNQLQEQKKMQEDFQRNLAANPEFQRQHQKLLNQGYNLSDSTINPVTNNTGAFEMEYMKPGGETASMEGEMVDGALRNLRSQTAEDRKRILEQLGRDAGFKKLDDGLRSEGFNQSQPVFNQLTQNHTRIVVPYGNGSVEKKITADYINASIQNVSLQEEVAEKEKREMDLWLPLSILVSALIAWMLYSRYWRRREEGEVEVPVEEVDFVAEARALLEEAKRLFSEGREKDACERVSQAVRYYFSSRLGLKRELIDVELLDILQGMGLSEYSDVRECLNLCSLVEFAKYKPNKKDFMDLIDTAEKVVTEA